MRRSLLIAFILAICFSLRVNADALNNVIMFQQDARHTGKARFVGNGNKKPSWSIWAGGQIWGSPVIDDNDVIYVGSRKKLMVAIDSTGKKK